MAEVILILIAAYLPEIVAIALIIGIVTFIINNWVGVLIALIVIITFGIFAIFSNKKNSTNKKKKPNTLKHSSEKPKTKVSKHTVEKVKISDLKVATWRNDFFYEYFTESNSLSNETPTIRTKSNNDRVIKYSFKNVKHGDHIRLYVERSLKQNSDVSVNVISFNTYYPAYVKFMAYSNESGEHWSDHQILKGNEWTTLSFKIPENCDYINLIFDSTQDMISFDGLIDDFCITLS